MSNTSNNTLSRIRVTKEFSFEMAHMLEGYDGPCSEIHGHSYRLFVTVAGTPCSDPQNPKYGMVGGRIVDVYDHSLVVRRTADNGELIRTLAARFGKLQAVEFQPTCENLVTRFAETIAAELPRGVELFSLRLHETATSYAEWFASDTA